MRRRWKILVMAACGFVATAIVLLLPDKGPSLNGRRLSDRIYDTIDLNTSPQRRHPERTESGKEIIRNAALVVPVLLEWHAAQTSQTRTGVYQSLPDGLQSNWLRYLIVGDADRRNLLADLGFEILGTNALPFLKGPLTDPDPELRTAAEQVLRYITNSSKVAATNPN